MDFNHFSKRNAYGVARNGALKSRLTNSVDGVCASVFFFLYKIKLTHTHIKLGMENFSLTKYKTKYNIYRKFEDTHKA